MVQTTPKQLSPEHGPATLRALRSLTRRDSEAVSATVRASGGEWTVEEHDDYDGYLSVLLTPAQALTPAYLVSGRIGAIELAELRGDDMIALGTFPSIGAAMSVLRPFLEAECWAVNPGRAPQRALSVQQAANRAGQLIDRHGSDADLHAALCADREPACAGEGWRRIMRALDELTATAPVRS